jgi:hypothetical protein
VTSQRIKIQLPVGEFVIVVFELVVNLQNVVIHPIAVDFLDPILDDARELAILVAELGGDCLRGASRR